MCEGIHEILNEHSDERVYRTVELIVGKEGVRIDHFVGFGEVVNHETVNLDRDAFIGILRVGAKAMGLVLRDKIHDDEPSILEDEAYEAWLRDNSKDKEGP